MTLRDSGRRMKGIERSINSSFNELVGRLSALEIRDILVSRRSFVNPVIDVP